MIWKNLHERANMKRNFLGFAVLVLFLSACGGAKQGIEIQNAWSRPAMQGGNGGVFFELQNHGPTADELTGASSEVAEIVEIHESKMEGDVMQMRMIPSLLLNANEKVTFQPGGLHVMLINLKQDLQTDDEFDIILHFKNHEDVTVRVIVRDTAPDGDHDM
jgi:copper(I)-binding protein